MGGIIGGAKPQGPDPDMVAAQKRQMDREEKRSAELDAQEDAR